ncbi:Uncharacterised protein [uncultured archaeon]|nr:Uncharacterised protein [uncultured archaeon]
MAMKLSLDRRPIFSGKIDAEEALMSAEDVFEVCTGLINEIFESKR